MELECCLISSWNFFEVAAPTFALVGKRRDTLLGCEADLHFCQHVSPHTLHAQKIKIKLQLISIHCIHITNKIKIVFGPKSLINASSQVMMLVHT
jgi:hypothetical protein